VARRTVAALVSPTLRSLSPITAYLWGLLYCQAVNGPRCVTHGRGKSTVSKPTKARQRPQLSKAEIKAYEARRAAEGRRALIVPEAASNAPAAGGATITRGGRRGYTLTRDEEYVIIRSDLRRLLFILAVLAVVLVACTLLLR
jgi:hypothetical protein